MILPVRSVALGVTFLLPLAEALAADPVPAPATAPVSWWRDINPLFKRSCNGCHNPNKLKAEVDTSTFAGLAKPGKHGPNYVAGKPAESRLIEEISGAQPSMPKEGDPFSAEEVGLVTRWILEGAKDDTPPDAYSFKLKEPPTYRALPVITALEISPDGRSLAIAGYHEAFLFDAESLELRARLVGDSPRIESLAFSPDSKKLAVAAGAPARRGEIQVWDVAEGRLLKAWNSANDSVYGVSWSPDATRLAFGGADKTVRVIAADDGKALMRFDNHSDWVFRTTWLPDGRRLLSGSRDQAMKLIDTTNGQFIDDINKLVEPVVSLARHPKEEWAAYGGAQGGVRVYRIKENQERTAANKDVNLVREFERQPGAVQAVAWSADGSLLAVGSTGGEARVFRSADGSRAATLGGHTGAIFALAFHPDGQRVFSGGFDGLVRVFHPTNATLQAVFMPIALTPEPGPTLAGDTPVPPTPTGR